MATGVYTAYKKDGTEYYRVSLTCQNKHISLGSFPTEEEAHLAYKEGTSLLSESEITLENYTAYIKLLDFAKAITLLNFRDNGVYIKNPIYLKQNYFLYFLAPQTEYKFDIDDLFFYSSHKIMQRGGRLFVNEYGMQTGILSRYGVRNHAVLDVDYTFANGNPFDYSYANIIVINRYRGVVQTEHNGLLRYQAFIHINGNYSIGTYSSEEKAAIAYNKAVDLAKAAGIHKNFEENYITELSAREYAEIYTNLKISPKYINYLSTLSAISD